MFLKFFKRIFQVNVLTWNQSIGRSHKVKMSTSAVYRFGTLSHLFLLFNV